MNLALIHPHIAPGPPLSRFTPIGHANAATSRPAPCWVTVEVLDVGEPARELVGFELAGPPGGRWVGGRSPASSSATSSAGGSGSVRGSGSSGWPWRAPVPPRAAPRVTPLRGSASSSSRLANRSRRAEVFGPERGLDGIGPAEHEAGDRAGAVRLAGHDDQLVTVAGRVGVSIEHGVAADLAAGRGGRRRDRIRRFASGLRRRYGRDAGVERVRAGHHFSLPIEAPACSRPTRTR